MKTKISLVLLGLGLVSASAYAGAVAEPMPVSNDINVTAPDQSGMWSFGATAVLMQPTNEAFNYANVTDSTMNSAGDQVNIDTDHKSVNEGYGWWFGADVSYAFPGNGRDVTLAYEGLRSSGIDNASGAPPLGSSNPVSPVLVSSFTGLPYETAEGETDTNYDAGDLVFGQKLDVGSRIRLHPFVGVRYAHINTEDTATYGNGFRVRSFPTSTYSAGDAKLENTFNGIGPRFGSDAQINLSQGFSVRARLGLSVLIGSRSVDNTGSVFSYDATNTVVGVTTASDNNDSETRIVPEIDGRLGLNYTYDFDSNMALGFEAGWQATNYFNVIADQYQMGGLASSGTQHYQDNSSFGIQGPYARIQLDVA